MKVNIGPYKNFWGPYQIASLLKYVGVSPQKCDDIGDWLAETWVNKFLKQIYSKRKRKIKVHIDDYDVWNADQTMALIIHPILVKIRDSKPGSSFVDDEDVPENLRSTAAKPKENKWDTDDFYHQRWEWVLDEMIYAFSTIIDEDFCNQYYDHETNFFNKEKYEELNNRANNGFRLFGKYYGGLWT
jgi:hypothetical protein